MTPYNFLPQTFITKFILNIFLVLYCYLQVEIMSTYTHLFPVLPTMAAVICMGGAALLFLRGRNNRSRRMLAFIMSAWGLIYVVRVVGMLLEIPGFNFTRSTRSCW